MYWVGPHVPQSLWRGVLVLSLLTTVAELAGHSVPTGARGSISFIPSIALLAISPNWLGIAGVTASVSVACTVRGLTPIKIVFNGAQKALASAITVAAFLALGGAPLQSSLSGIGAFSWQYLGLVAACSLVFIAVNTASVYGVIAISQGKPFLPLWKKAIGGSIVPDALSSPLVYLLVWLYVRWGIVGALAFSVPLFVTRRFYMTNRQLEQVNLDLLELMVKAIEARDPYTSGHSRRVSQYSRIIARAVGLSSAEIERVAIVALLHDVGKIHEVYAPILRKPEKLNPGEWAVMQTHPIKSAELVATVSHLKDIVEPVRHHHENWDGTGYPDGLQGHAIPVAARIVLFADTIDAMTTDRPYRKALTEAQVRSELVKFRGKQFDPEMCDRLLGSPMFGLLFAPQQRSRTPERTKPVVTERTEGTAAR
jgi:hypothetical protein